MKCRGVVGGDTEVAVTLKGGERLQAPLAVGADGRRSLCREAAGIALDERRYDQIALTLSFRHSRPHRDISTEFHTPSGPFTLVPLPGNRSSLVWVLEPADADAIGALDDTDLSIEIERAAHSILGKIEVDPGRGLFPLSVAAASRFAANRIALIGEAAHVIPPIGAQGLNLGLRDAAAICEARGGSASRRRGHRRHRRARALRDDAASDIGSRTLAIDLLNRTLLTDFLPIQGARGLGFISSTASARCAAR